MTITHFAKLSVLIFLLIFSITGISYGSSALEIMTKVDARYTGDSAISDWRMILIDKKDRKRVREIAVSYTHLRAHDTKANGVCRIGLEKK